MIWLLFSCKTAPVGGSVTCNANPSSAWAGTPVFREVTDSFGLTGMTAGRFAVGDLNGDKYPDILATEVYQNDRDRPDEGVFYHRVLINNAGQGFTDTTVESGLITARDGNLGTSSHVHVLGDVDNDGDLDVFAGRFLDTVTDDPTPDRTEIYLNDGTGHFSLAPISDIHEPDGYPTSGASFLDFNGDGLLDLWVVGWYLAYGSTNTAPNPNLYQGNGDGTFTRVSEAQGIELPYNVREDFYAEAATRPAYGATTCDINHDGFTDLIQTNYGRSWNHLWMNGNGIFTEVGQAAHFAADENLDYTDNLMYVCYCEENTCDPAPSKSCNGAFPSNYWSPGFDDQPVRLNGNSFTTICEDIDNDGDLDLYTAEIKHDWAGESADGSQLLLNDGTGIFERIDNQTNGLYRERPRNGSWNEGDIHAAFFDFDNDGWKDILLGSSDYEDTHIWLWRQVSPGQFQDVSDESGMNQPWPAGLAVADFDLDGDLDVVSGSSNARTGTPWTNHQIHVYLNDTPAGNWVRIEGFPIGTRVEVRSGGLTQVREVSGGYGHFGIQNDVALHFGLGAECLVDEVVATFPGGKIRKYGPFAGNQTIRP